MKLLIVESPTKAKTLTKYLPDYRVVASNGHIIDLPAKSFGVDVENNFKPNYEVIDGKQQIIAMLKKEAAEADEIFIGSDPDREGEAIAHHIASLFQDKLIHRVLFHEITKNAVLKAIENYSEINEDLFNAQQARRILDRIVGYKLSAFLWRSVKKGLSAGRVQSVALQMVTEREKEIRAFVPEEYWSFKGDFAGKNGTFDAALEKVDGKKVAVSNEADAKKLKAEIDKASNFSVVSVEKREKRESPLPPLNTSNLQQESSRLFNYTGEQTMKIAQSLYEGKNLGAEGFTGLITYMRTDSFRISDEANAALRKYIAGNIGSQFLSEEVRYYKNQTRSKGKIQDAHEAIRPTNVELTPEKVASKLTKDELNIYTLIWRRFIATQMKDAVLETTAVTVEDSEHRYSFKKSGSVVQFEGYRKIYKKQSKDETIPKVEEGEPLTLSALAVEQHFT
ncbi:type I DNA topoisomerase, partial [bacterium]|nr:type I DNA topoisomerase [bacterium]